MGSTIGLRLLDAGRVPRQLLGDALAAASVGRISEAETLFALGVDPDLIARTAAEACSVELVAPTVDAERASVLMRLVPRAFARRALALPLRIEAGALVCAFADPCARNLVDEVARMARRPVRVVCATVPAILAGQRSLYGTTERPEARPVFSFAGRASFTAKDEPGPNLRPDRGPGPGGERRSPSGSFEAVPPAETTSPREPVSDVEALERWDVGPTAHPPRTVAVSAAAPREINTRRRYDRDPRPLPQPYDDIGAAVAAVKSATTRERVVETLLHATLAHARQAFCFRLREGRLEGMDSAGSSLGALAVRRIVLPLSTSSTLHQVLTEGRPHFGALYAGATDQVLRAAIGSRGGRVSMHGLWIEGRPVALLVADDVRTGEIGHERIGALAHAASTALRRLLMERG